MYFPAILDTPDTAAYMIGGYIVLLALPILFIASLFYRYRNLKQNEAAIEDLKEERK